MKIATITYIVNPHTQEVLMAKKTRKIGVGFWFGYGGKITWWQTPRGNAKNEIWVETGGDPQKRKNLHEEGGIRIKKKDLEFMGVMDFYNNPKLLKPSFRVYCYRLQKYKGTAVATEEMSDPHWFLTAIMKELDSKGEMKPGDMLFVPSLLKGVPVRGYIRFSERKEVIDYQVEFPSVKDLREPKLPGIFYMIANLFIRKAA